MSFFDGLLLGVLGYWTFGFFTKGFAEPIQAHLGKLFFAKLEKENIKVKKHVEQSITKIDDLFLSAPSNFLTSVNRIVNGDELSGTERLDYRRLLDETYRLTALVAKLNLNQK